MYVFVLLHALTEKILWSHVELTVPHALGFRVLMPYHKTLLWVKPSPDSYLLTELII